MTASEGDSSRLHRLHGSTLIFRIGMWIRRLLVPALLAILVAQDAEWEFWLMIGFVPVVVYEIIRYFTFRYTLADDEIVMRWGLLFKNERHVPYARVQNIDLVQNPLHRFLHVATARLETAGGKKPEAVLSELSMSDIQELRLRVFAGRGVTTDRAVATSEIPAESGDSGGAAAAASGAEAEKILHVPVLELIKLGLIANRSMAMALVALGAAWEFNLFERFGIYKRFESFYEALELRTAILVLIGVGLVVIVLLVLLSTIWTIVRLHEFRMERSGDDLRLTCGLLTRLSATIPRHRIQKVSVHESLPHRWFGRVTVRVETAGGVSEEKKDISRKWFLPLVPKAEVRQVLERLGIAEAEAEAIWQPLAKRALVRMIKKRLFAAVIVAVVIGFIFSFWAALIGFGVLIPLAVWHARATRRHLSYAHLSDALAFRSGVLTRKLSTVRFEKMQIVSFSQTPFDRMNHMANVSVDTAGAGPAEHAISVPYLDERIGRALFDELTAKTEQSRLRW